MAILATSQSELAWVRESTLGTTPDNPKFKAINSISDSFEGTVSTETSTSIRADRQKSDLVSVSNEVGGDLNFHLDIDNFREFLTDVMLTDDSDVRTDRLERGTLTTIQAVAAAKTFTTNGDTNYFRDQPKVGDKVRVTGYTGANADLNGIYTIASVNTNNRQITVVEDVARNVTATAQILYKYYRNGQDAPNLFSYTFMKKYAHGGDADMTDLDTTLDDPLYHYFRGMVPNTLSISVSTTSLLDCTVGFVGRTDELTAGAVSGQTLKVAPTESLIASGDDVDITATTLSNGHVNSCSLTVDNQVTQARAVGSLDVFDEAAFGLSVTGDIEFYFEDKSAFDLFAQESSFPLTLKFQGGTSYWELHLPKCKVTSLDNPRPGQDQFLFVTAGFEALRDATAGYTIESRVI